VLLVVCAAPCSDSSDARHSREEQVLVELSVQQFYDFLRALETAQQLM
jgi:hypothetical protein